MSSWEFHEIAATWPPHPPTTPAPSPAEAPAPAPAAAELTSAPAPARPAIVRVDSWRAEPKVPAGVKGKSRPRWIEKVTAIGLHQTAVAGGFGVSRAMIALAGGDPAAARRKRYRATPYHAIYDPQSRQSIVQWPATLHSYHGNGMNAYTLGWAYDDRIDPTHQPELDVDGAREALAHLVEVGREQGCPLRWVEAHRQHSDQRGRDPGEELWQALRPIFADLGLTERPAHTTGSGRTLPPAWLR